MALTPRLVRTSLMSLVVAAALAVIGFADIASGSKNNTVRIAVGSLPAACCLGLYAAIDRGYFAGEGIDVVLIPSTTTPVETFIRQGKAELGITTAADVIVYRSRGLGYRAIAAVASQAARPAVRGTLGDDPDAGDGSSAVYVAGDGEISQNAGILRLALAALAEGSRWAAAHPAAAERILVDYDPAEPGATGEIAGPNGSGPTAARASGRWGKLSGSDFAQLETVLAKRGLIKAAPAPGDLYTNALLP
jgi:ABC-type nitrate/sulfonate/bicarbonate transport system substrate-binding protein